MKLTVQHATREHIIGETAIKDFIYACLHDLGLGIGFHPDNSFEDYIFKASEKRIFTDQEAKELNNTLNECKDQCKKLKLSITSIWLDIYQPLFDSIAQVRPWHHQAQQSFKIWKMNNNLKGECSTQHIDHDSMQEEHIVYPAQGGMPTAVTLKATKNPFVTTIVKDGKEYSL